MHVCACACMCVSVMLQVTQTELERMRSSYRQAAKDAAQAKRKLEEASKGVASWLLSGSFTQLERCHMNATPVACVQTKSEKRLRNATQRPWPNCTSCTMSTCCQRERLGFTISTTTARSSRACSAPCRVCRRRWCSCCKLPLLFLFGCLSYTSSFLNPVKISPSHTHRVTQWAVYI